MANPKSELPNYLTQSELVETTRANGGGVQVVNPISYGNKGIQDIVSQPDILQGIECAPYQFMDTVDKRYTYQTEDNDLGISTVQRYLGQKYAQKVIGQMPLVFFTPCEPVFMQDFSNEDKDRVLGYLTSGDGSGLNFIMDKNAQYYGVKYAYADYYNYVNLMLSSMAYYLGIHKDTIMIDGKPTELRYVNWANNTNSSFKSFFSSKENVMFFADSLSSVDLQFSNNTTQSSLASQINGFSDQVHELQFLLGGDESVIQSVIDTGIDSTSSISKAFTDALGTLGGGLVGSLADRGVNTILNGGKIIFPEIWADSQHDESYSLTFKLRSPDHDSLSIFLNILKPYCLLLALALPRSVEGNANAYRSPFLLKCSSRGIFNINMGIIDSLSVTKGEECQWNDDGLPTQMDVSISVKNLYSHLAMSGFKDNGYLVTNTQFQDFIANTAGLNVLQYNANIGEKINYDIYKLSEAFVSYPGRKYNEFSNAISNLIYNVAKRI